MAPTHLTIGTVLFANEESILLTDRTLFLVPVKMRLPHYRAGTSLVIEYEIVEGRNILAHVPKVRE
jgi:hypothetical protein